MPRQSFLRFVIVWILVITGFGLSSLVHAQDTTSPLVEQLQVDLWPQYDDPRLLVIYNGTLAAPPDQPLRFPIPAGAMVNAVAQVGEDNRLVNVPWKAEASDDLQVIAFTPETTRFQLEYYLDVIGSGTEKSFSVDIGVGDQTVNVLGIAAQQPAGTSNLQGEPPLSGPVVGFQNLDYFSRELDNVQPGQTVHQTVTYSKPDDTLTVDQIGPAPSEPAVAQPSPAPSGSGFSTNFVGRSTTQFWLPLLATAIILVGMAMIGVGALRARRESVEPVPPTTPRRGQRTRPRRTPADGEGLAKFCHQCGAGFAPEDQFCAECGAPRRGV